MRRIGRTTAVVVLAIGCLAAGAGTAVYSDPRPRSETEPVIDRWIVTDVRAIPYPTRVVEDSSLPEGVHKLRRRGVAGKRAFIYQVTRADDGQRSNRLLRTKLVAEPVARVIALGTS
jgi:resuscitation-promoting factor RpfB